MKGKWVGTESEYLPLSCSISSFMMATEDGQPSVGEWTRTDSKNVLFRTKLQDIQIQKDQKMAIKSKLVQDKSLECRRED
jgi:hypothetical protein